MNNDRYMSPTDAIFELIRERDDLALRLEGVEAHRERLLEDARTRDEGHHLALTATRKERDEARERLRIHLADERSAQALLDDAREEVKRLRAAQQLPDVGPVTRTDPDEDGWTWLRVGGYRGFFNPHISADEHRLSAARELALAAFLDAEAVDHTPDDEAHDQEAGQ